MKIQDPSLSGINLTTGGSQPAAKVQSTERVNGRSATAASQGRDAVQISSLSREVEAFQRELRADPQRDNRVESLQASVVEGRYQPDPHQVSQSLIQEAFEY